MADEAAIGVTPQPEPAPRAVYPWPELAGPLEALQAECASLDSDVQRVIDETKATIDAMTALADKAFAEVAGRAREIIATRVVTAELDDQQTSNVLRHIHQEAKQAPGPTPPQADLPIPTDGA
jgi:hypothetical protein